MCSPSWLPAWVSRTPAESTICTACLAFWVGWLGLLPWLLERKMGKYPPHTHAQFLTSNLTFFSRSEGTLSCKLQPWLLLSALPWLAVWLQVGGSDKCVDARFTGLDSNMRCNCWFSLSRTYNEDTVLGSASWPELLRWLFVLGGKKSHFS